MRAATLADDGPFEETKGGIEQDGLLGIQVRGGGYRQIVIHSMDVILYRYDLQPALSFIGQPSFSIYHTGKFPDGHTMRDGDGELPDTGLQGHVEDRAIDIAVRVGAVKDDQLFAGLGAGFHDISQCIDIRVKAAADVLDIVD